MEIEGNKLTEKLAKYVVDLKFENLPKNVIEGAKKVSLDLLGIILAGSSQPGCKNVVDLIRFLGGREESTIIAYGGKFPAPMASLANGMMGRALDFSDTHDRAGTHTSACSGSATLAVAERQEVGGKDFILAFTLGMDIHARMALACSRKTRVTDVGWAWTSVMGIFGATAAASKILNLNEEEVVNALGIAYSMAAGNMQGVLDGALTVRLQPGLGAMNGVLSSLLAREGVTGPTHALEGKYGLYNIYLRGTYDPTAITEGLGRRFEVVNLSLKPYPCCRFTHTAIDAALEIVSKYHITPEDVDSVDIGITRQVYVAVCEPLELKYMPKTVVDAQFSLPYIVACALVKKEVFINSFTTKSIKRKDVLKISRRVKPRVDPELEKLAARKAAPPVIVKIKTKNGKEYSARVDVPKGSPKNPLTMEEVEEKFRGCAHYCVKPLPSERLKEIIGKVTKLDKIDNIVELTELLY